MTIHPAHSNRIGTTSGARAILVTVGGVLGDRHEAADTAPVEPLPHHVAVRPANSVGRERVWCDAIR
jgi:hypothetical protein